MGTEQHSAESRLASTRRQAGQAVADTRLKVLVLLASYNGEAWIGSQLESILAQDGVETHICVRDDGSSDGTVREIARFGADQRITLSHGCPGTGSAAQNFLALIRDNAAEACDFVAFADQDDIWHAGKLQRACRMLRTGASVGYSGATIATWPDGRKAVLRQTAVSTAADFLFEGAGQGCTFVLRADFYQRVRQFALAHQALTREVRYHDWMVYALARVWGYRWTFDSHPLTSYRQHEGNDTGARSAFAGVRKRFTLIRQRWYRAQIAAISAVCTAAAPTNEVLARWNPLFHSAEGWRRRCRIAAFCLRSGRRKRRDNMMVVFAALAGWI